MQPYGLQPIRLLSSWASPGKNTGVGCPYPPPGDLPDPGIKPASPSLQADSLLLSHQGSACMHTCTHTHTHTHTHFWCLHAVRGIRHPDMSEKRLFIHASNPLDLLCDYMWLMVQEMLRIKWILFKLPLGLSPFIYSVSIRKYKERPNSEQTSNCIELTFRP